MPISDEWNEDDHMWLNRTLCDVLEDMRKANENRNYSYLAGLIEEAQSMGNRMEAALGDQKDVEKMQARWHELKDEIKALKAEKAQLEKDLGKEKAAE